MLMLVKMALRNLKRYSRRTFITCASIALGLAILLWLQCILAGRNENMIQKITSTSTGHLQILRQDYLENRTPNRSFNFDFELPYAHSPRIYLPSLASTAEDSVPILLQGIIPLNESKVTDLKTYIVQGEYLSEKEDSPCALREVLVGEELTKHMNLELGDKIVILTQANDGTFGNELLRITGIFNSGSPGFDKNNLFTHLSCAANIGVVNGVHEVSINVGEAKILNNVYLKLKDTLPQGLVMTTWKEVIPGISTLLNFNDAFLKVLTFILFTVIVLGVINTLLINIFERTKEFGVMLALGTSTTQLMLLILFECLFIGVFSIVVGIALGALAVSYHLYAGFDLSLFLGETSGAAGFKFDLIIYPIFELLPFLKLSSVVIVFIVLAGLYPALRASRVSPSEVMRS